MSTVTRYCIRCKEDRAVDALSFRCLTCGTPTKHLTPAEADQAPPAKATPATVTLPSNQASRRWMEQTRVLAEGFRKDAIEARARAAEAIAKAERLEVAAGAYEGLLKQVALDEAPPDVADVTRTRRWARQYDACVNRGRTDVKHAAHGLCRICDGKRRAAA